MDKTKKPTIPVKQLLSDCLDDLGELNSIIEYCKTERTFIFDMERKMNKNEEITDMEHIILYKIWRRHLF